MEGHEQSERGYCAVTGWASLRSSRPPPLTYSRRKHSSSKEDRAKDHCEENEGEKEGGKIHSGAMREYVVGG